MRRTDRTVLNWVNMWNSSITGKWRSILVGAVVIQLEKKFYELKHIGKELKLLAGFHTGNSVLKSTKEMVSRCQ